MSVVECFVCDECDEHNQPGGEQIVQTRNGEYEWCEGCVSYFAWECEGCQVLFGESLESHETGSGDTVCNECYESYEDERLVKSHDFEPAEGWQMHGVGSVGYGIELEMDTRGGRETAVEYIAEKIPSDVAIMKEDGSLSSDGIELVSHPRTFDSWNESKEQWSAWLAGVASCGMESWTQSQCGLHVHMTRAGMSASHQVRFGLLFNRNALDWQGVARRSSSFANFNEGETVTKVKVRYSANHFDAVNFSNTKTIEVRIFRPSLQFGRVLGSIALVHFAREYTRTLTAHDVLRGALEWSRFTAWVEAQGHVEASVLLRGGNFGMVAG